MKTIEHYHVENCIHSLTLPVLMRQTIQSMKNGSYTGQYAERIYRQRTAQLRQISDNEHSKVP